MLRLFRSNPAVLPKQRVVADPLLTLARAVKSGDRAATRTLVVSVTPVLLRAARGVLGVAHPDVEDTAQEAALGLVKALGEYREDCSVAHFAARIAALTALAHRRKLKVRGAGLHQELDLDVPSTCDCPAEALLAARRRAVLRQLCDELPAAQSEALILHCVLGMSVEEIAATADCPTNTVKSRLRLAKDAMRLRIGADPAMSDLLGVTP